MTFLSRLILAWTCASLLTGCFFDRPLTGGATEGINTWLLGVWKTTNDQGQTARAMVTPQGSDHYSVDLSLPGKSSGKTMRYSFDMWSSRVGSTLFLTLHCLESSGDIPVGKYVFIQPQLLDQNSIRIRNITLHSDPAATSYELRKEIRLRLKEHSLYEGSQSILWERMEEIFSDKTGHSAPFMPLRNPESITQPLPTPTPIP